jgi:hypothetical protein
MRSYRIIAGSAAERFHNSRSKIRVYAGGFANGKTTALVADALRVAKDYPGCTMLLGRATFPKLNSTLRREFFKWCPRSWIKSFNKGENTCILQNDTTIDFRYIDQRTSGESEQTSNLLSANYDYIAIDQAEDPEITEHDFDQLLGRLRGATPYAGVDHTMPRTGPRQIALSCNPSLGWIYQRVVKPYHDYLHGRHNPDLICAVNDTGEPQLVDGRPIPLVEVFEASTYDNAQNLEPDYIATLEATYRGKMRDRYLLGKWVAFEGTVYDEFDDNLHVVPHSFIEQHVNAFTQEGYEPALLEGYDLGITEPSCYLLGITDPDGITYLVDGFYERNMGVEQQAALIHQARETYAPRMDMSTQYVWGDPQAAKRTSMAMATVGDSVFEMFRKQGIHMQRANNNIMNGILKVKARLYVRQTMLNPFTQGYGCPMVFFSDRLSFLRNEIISYRWRRGRQDQSEDKPVDADNHAMDVLRYMFTEDARRPTKRRHRQVLTNAVRKWHEMDRRDDPRNRSHRYVA